MRSTLGGALKAQPFSKPATFKHVTDLSESICFKLFVELTEHLERTNYRQSIERHTTQYLVETNGFFLRSCGNLLPFNIDTKSREQKFGVLRSHEQEFPFACSLMKEVESDGDLLLTRWGYSIIEPNARVLPHIDNTTYLYVGKRCMVELADSDYQFYVEHEQMPLKRGRVFEFNNNTIHSGRNYGTTKRLALIFDWIPNKWQP